MIGSRTCALVVLGAFGFLQPSAGRNSPIGSYSLTDIGSRHPPLYLGGGFNGEGASLDSAFLLMKKDGRFRARVVASWTDSGTVVHPRTTHGRWRIQGGSIVFKYAKVASTGECWYRTCHDSSVADTGTVVSDGINFHRFVGLGPSLFGRDAVLHFRRTSR